jgi:hypothetical protein
MKPELGMTTESFGQSMWSLLRAKHYPDILKVYDLLPRDHPFKSQDVYVIAILASSGSYLPKKVRPLCSTLSPLFRCARSARH